MLFKQQLMVMVGQDLERYCDVHTSSVVHIFCLRMSSTEHCYSKVQLILEIE